MVQRSISLAKVGRVRINPVHLLVASLFLILAGITIRAILFGDSLFIYRDLNASEPSKALQDAISAFDLESARRLLYLGPYFAATSILGLSTLMVQKLTLLLTHFIIGYFAYLASYKFLTSRINDEKDKLTILIVSVIFGFFYLYNPRVSEGLSLTTLGIGFSYSLIPLAFYYFDRMLNEKGFYNIFVTALLISLAIAATSQFVVQLPLFVLLPWLIIVTIYRWIKKYSVILTIKNSLILIGLCFLLSSYWLIPTVLAILNGSLVQPSYILTNQSLTQFSSPTSFINVFRIMGSFWPWIELTPIINISLWNAFTFFVPVGVVLSILLLKDRRLKFYALSFALIITFIIFFNKGNQPPLTDIYPLLYDVPLVGWMFRVPSSLGKFLPFYMGMIITFGLYSLLSYRPKKMRYFKYGLAGILVLSVSIVSWPMFTGDFGGIYQDNNKFVENTPHEESYHIYVPRQSIMVFGDLNKLKLAESVFHSNYSSLIMTGHNLNILQQNEVRPDKVIIDNKEDLPFYFLDSNAIVIDPFTATRNHKPSEVWSIARTNDPLHGAFHVYLKKFGINNTDMDYNKGVALTWGKDELHMPLEVKGTTDYHLFARYLESEAGGEMKVSLDGRTASSIFTKGSENKFVWKDIGTFDDLTNGKHTLMLQNDNGLNAVNIFVLIPSDALMELDNRVNNFIARSKLIYMLDSDDLLAQGSVKNIIDEQSNQTALRIDPRSSAYREIDLPKASNYTIAINAKTCQECQTLNVSIGSFSKEFSLQSPNEGFRWFYFPVTLEAGKTNMHIYSEEGAYITTVLIQSNNGDDERPDPFAANETSVVISDTKRLSPTKYEISVSAERPFIVTFDRPYDNLWSAFVNGREYDSLMLYPSINGFYINDSGLLDITIEYKPHVWLVQGIIVTILTIIGSVGYLLWQKREKISDHLKWFRKKVLDHREAGG